MVSFRMSMWTLLPVLAVMVGCEARKPAGTVTGTVTYQGKPVSGEVAFYAKAIGAGATATLDAGGNFQFDAPLPPATYTVSVTPPPPTPGDPTAKTGPAKSADSTVPTKFRDPTTSNVTVTVADDENRLPIVMPKK